jgi:chaperonin GroEL (HSP60 family)
MLRQAAENTGDIMGDASSIAAVPAYAILSDGIRNAVAGASATDLRRGLNRATAIAAQRGDVPPGQYAQGKGPGRRHLHPQRSHYRWTGCLSAAVPAQSTQSAGEPEKVGDDCVVVARMKSGDGSIGFDAVRKAFIDLMEAGIIDPTKEVVRTALESAVSVARALLTEATMTELPEPRESRVPELEAEIP